MGVSVRRFGVMPIVTADLVAIVNYADLPKRVVVVLPSGERQHVKDVYIDNGAFVFDLSPGDQQA